MEFCRATALPPEYAGNDAPIWLLPPPLRLLTALCVAACSSPSRSGEFVAVTGITGIPADGTAGTPIILSGNVFEWRWDRHSDQVGAGSETDPAGAASGTSRVGSWADNGIGSAVSYRSYYSPNSVSSDLGFRVVCP
jgi:hypothetical protein